ncbi:DUF3592 domain-containing protein [Streptomyces sp. NPDC047002]|uniref:DUF3592 domain-containing protein n=1 Tax=Streptomyces sp. NPDC047002 TaxID=3155475 RepID=UPI003456D0E5
MSLIEMAVGFIIFCSGIHEAFVQRRLTRDGRRVRGLVVRHDSRSIPGGSSASFAVVEFVDAWGVPHTFHSRSSGIGKLPVGGELPVRYSPAEPDVARIDRTGKNFLKVGFILFGGVWLFLVGFFVYSGIWTGSGTPHGR